MWLICLFLYFISVGVTYKLLENANDDAVWMALFWPLWLICILIVSFAYLGIITGIFIVNLFKR